MRTTLLLLVIVLIGVGAFLSEYLVYAGLLLYALIISHKSILRGLSIILVKYLQRRYRMATKRNYHNRTNQVLARLILIQSILYYFKRQFHAWGYFHYGSSWPDKDEKFYRWLFPVKDFEEIDIVVWYNPSAVAYYQNKIYLQRGKSPNYEKEIKEHLLKWNEWT